MSALSGAEVYWTIVRREVNNLLADDPRLSRFRKDQDRVTFCYLKARELFASFDELRLKRSVNMSWPQLLVNALESLKTLLRASYLAVSSLTRKLTWLGRYSQRIAPLAFSRIALASILPVLVQKSCNLKVISAFIPTLSSSTSTDLSSAANIEATLETIQSYLTPKSTLP